MKLPPNFFLKKKKKKKEKKKRIESGRVKQVPVEANGAVNGFF